MQIAIASASPSSRAAALPLATAGARLLTSAEPVLFLGRSDLGNAAPEVLEKVSRQHCRLQLLDDDPPQLHVQLTAVSKCNATFVLRPPAGGDATCSPASASAWASQGVEAVHPGQSAVLRAGDGVSLLPPQHPLTPSCAFLLRAAAPGAATAMAAAPPPSLQGAAADAHEEDGDAEVVAMQEDSGVSLGDVGGEGGQGIEQDGEDEMEQEEAGAEQPASAEASGSPGDASARRPPPGAMLVLVGPPGAGKSTFAQALVAAAPDTWQVVNQDTIANGKPGTKKKCLTVAQSALSTGRSVIVDRCNVDLEQRGAFVQLAQRLRSPLHAVVFALPLKVCVARATARTDHPSGVQGPRAAGLVAKFHKALTQGGGAPDAQAERFATVMQCPTPAHVDVALAAWKLHRRGDGSSATAAAATDQGAGAAAAAAAGDPWGHWTRNQPAGPASGRGGAGGVRTLHSFFGAGRPAGGGASASPAAANGGGPKPMGGGSGGGGSAAAKASLGAGVGASGSQPGRGATATQQVQQRQAPAAPGGPAPSPPRLAGGSSGGAGGGTPGTLPKAAKRARMQGDGADAGAGTPAPAPAPAPAPQPPQAPPQQQQAAAPRNAFAMLMQGAATQQQRPQATGKGGGSSAATSPPGGAGGGGGGGGGTKFYHPSQQQLYQIAMSPSRIEGQPGVFVDDRVVRLLDKYPKARHHALVLPRLRGLDAPADLRREHLPLLQHMRGVALRWVEEARRQEGDSGAAGPPSSHVFRLGFHAHPSMRHLHLHVISQDLCGAAMKSKKHYMTFTAPFFVSLDEVERQLGEHGRVVGLPPADVLKGELVCHRCGRDKTPAGGKRWTFPDLLAHLRTCPALYGGADAVVLVP